MVIFNTKNGTIIDFFTIQIIFKLMLNLLISIDDVFSDNFGQIVYDLCCPSKIFSHFLILMDFYGNSNKLILKNMDKIEDNQNSFFNNCNVL